LKPPTGVVVILYVAVCPALTAAVVDEADREKSGVGVAVETENLVTNAFEQEGQMPELTLPFDG
jgi:hypothetical protein